MEGNRQGRPATWPSSFQPTSYFLQKNDFFRFLRTFLLGGTIILPPVFLPAQSASDYRVFDTYQSGPDRWMAHLSRGFCTFIT